MIGQDGFHRIGALASARSASERECLNMSRRIGSIEKKAHRQSAHGACSAYQDEAEQRVHPKLGRSIRNQFLVMSSVCISLVFGNPRFLSSVAAEALRGAYIRPWNSRARVSPCRMTARTPRTSSPLVGGLQWGAQGRHSNHKGQRRATHTRHDGLSDPSC